MDTSIGTVFAIFTILDDQSAIDTISTILAIFAYFDRVRTDSIIHEDRNGCFAASILSNGRCQVISTIGMAVFCLRADDIDGTVQLVANRVRAIFNSRICTEFQTVVQRCNGMRRRASFAVFAILIDDPCDAILAIDTRRTILAVRTILADSLDNGSYTAIFAILTYEADRAVFTILAVFAEDEIIVQSDFDFIFRSITSRRNIGAVADDAQRIAVAAGNRCICIVAFEIEFNPACFIGNIRKV